MSLLPGLIIAIQHGQASHQCIQARCTLIDRSLGFGLRCCKRYVVKSVAFGSVFLLSSLYFVVLPSD